MHVESLYTAFLFASMKSSIIKIQHEHHLLIESHISVIQTFTGKHQHNHANQQYVLFE